MPSDKSEIGIDYRGHENNVITALTQEVRTVFQAFYKFGHKHTSVNLRLTASDILN